MPRAAPGKPERAPSLNVTATAISVRRADAGPVATNAPIALVEIQRGTPSVGIRTDAVQRKDRYEAHDSRAATGPRLLEAPSELP